MCLQISRTNSIIFIILLGWNCTACIVSHKGNPSQMHFTWNHFSLFFSCVETNTIHIWFSNEHCIYFLVEHIFSCLHFCCLVGLQAMLWRCRKQSWWKNSGGQILWIWGKFLLRTNTLNTRSEYQTSQISTQKMKLRPGKMECYATPWWLWEERRNF